MNRGLTLIEILIILVIVAVLAALIVPCFNRPFEIHTRVSYCANNLRQLYQIAHVYQARYKGRYPDAQGSAFWLALQKTDPPLIEVELNEIYFCPFKGDSRGPGETDYRGPAQPLNQFSPTDPVGADIVGNHDEKYGINVVRLAGDVQTVFRNDPLWAACDAQLSK